MELGEWIREARRRKGLSQEALAHLLGRTKANISGWEVGRHEPSIGQVLRISELTGHPIEGIAWPLPMVDRDRYYALSDLDRAYVQAKMAAAIEERERASTEDAEGRVHVKFGNGISPAAPSVSKRTTR